MGPEGRPKKGGLGRPVIIDSSIPTSEPDIVKRDPSVIIDEATRAIMGLTRFDDLHPCKDSKQKLLRGQLEKSLTELVKTGLPLPEIALQIGRRIKAEGNPPKKL